MYASRFSDGNLKLFQRKYSRIAVERYLARFQCWTREKKPNEINFSKIKCLDAATIREFLKNFIASQGEMGTIGQAFVLNFHISHIQYFFFFLSLFEFVSLAWISNFTIACASHRIFYCTSSCQDLSSCAQVTCCRRCRWRHATCRRKKI